ncbi:hypothetical protein UFOVP190_443 [uncultured Caudovirales phage]|uniref:Uncharacterized protein n=1 Tax=uncultured Caudovirales phage TaxID=2100421 RepID=A0A6J7WPV4_9CAUD|nr:hypothetical protein UFOVP190_443 [uncultured Caudovirales phage]
MLRYLSSKIMKWAREYNTNQRDLCEAVPSPVGIRGHDIEMGGLRFSVMPARGGTIVQLTSYDRAKDRNDTITHVIPDGEDVAATVGRIVSMELWRQ